MSINIEMMKIISSCADLWRALFPLEHPSDEEFSKDMKEQTMFIKTLAEIRMIPEVRQIMAENLRELHKHRRTK